MIVQTAEKRAAGSVEGLVLPGGQMGADLDDPAFRDAHPHRGAPTDLYVVDQHGTVARSGRSRWPARRATAPAPATRNEKPVRGRTASYWRGRAPVHSPAMGEDPATAEEPAWTW